MREYTLAFVFTPDLRKVLLLYKVSPPWQKGKINGIGGKVEQGESALDCIIREVEEETSLKIEKNKWKEIGHMREEGGIITVFTALYSGLESDARNNDKEDVAWFQIGQLPKGVISNLYWLIPLAVDVLRNDTPKKFEAVY